MRTMHHAHAYTICVIYRPPNANPHKYIEELQALLNKYINEKHLVLVGDINIDITQESQRTVSDYLNLLAEHGLYNVIKDYTREEYSGSKISKSCIDHIILRLSNQRHTSGVIKCKLADHYFVLLAVMSEKPINKGKTLVTRPVIDDAKVDTKIKNTNWNALLRLDHLSLYSRVVEIFDRIYDDSTKTVKIKQRKPDSKWITPDIMELCYLKDKAWQKSKKEPQNAAKRAEYCSLRNLVTAKLRLAKRRYLSQQFLLNKNDVKKTWKLVNDLMGRSKHACVEDAIKRNFPSVDTKEICDRFNDTFLHATEKLRDGNRDKRTEYQPKRTCVNTAFLPEISEVELWNIIKRLKGWKPPGFDRIRNRDLQSNFNVLKDVLLKILNGISPV